MKLDRVHFVGIGGAGMGALAELLLAQGRAVSGSDAAANAMTERLAQRGAVVHVGHDARHVGGEVDTVVVSTAVPAGNVEVAAAQARGIAVVPRAALLAELMAAAGCGIAVAGTHGKTTTTSLVATVLAAAGADPTFVVGGEVRSVGAHARRGAGAAFVAEADESDASFLRLAPRIAVVTNIDADHLDTYGGDVARLHAAFAEFVHRVPADGCAVLCADDPGVAALRPRVDRPVISYGVDADDADLRAVDVRPRDGGGMRFTLRLRDAADVDVSLNLAGVHNVRNALAAIAVALRLALPLEPVLQALATFAGVGRRFARHDVALADGGRCTLVDDYGHHPAELAAVLAAARGEFPGRRIVVAFQPHRYTRTRDCFDGFVDVLARADALLLAPVYAAGETPIDGAESADLARALAAAGRGDVVCVDGVDALPDAIRAAARDGDVVLNLGAGSIGGVPAHLTGAAAGGAADAAEASRVTRLPDAVNTAIAVTAPAAAAPATVPATSPRRADAASLGRVAVLMGGSSAEREVSLMSGRGVLAALRSAGVDAHAFDPAERDLTELKRDGTARVFVALHGRHGEDGTVQGALELLGLPYTGSGVMASAIAMDKTMTKRVWAAEGLPTPRWVLLSAGHHDRAALNAVPDTVGLPLVVKPPREGSSIGITKVVGYSQMADAVTLARRYDADVLCEEFVDGVELTCAVLGSGAAARALPVIRIDAPGGNYDYEHKYFSDDTGYRCPSGLSAADEADVQRLTLAAYRALGCRGWGRADLMRRAADGRLFLLEMNTSPGMTGHSLVPMAARAAGIDYAELCVSLLADAALDSAARDMTAQDDRAPVAGAGSPDGGER